MIFIADSGSTKADWTPVINGEKGATFSTKGFNPNAWISADIITELQKEFVHKMPVASASRVVFYGSGCWDAKRKKAISDALEVIFPHAKIEVQHDLLASARATCGDEPGIACILGTGSNSCLYDGIYEADNVTNLGYLIGDEGSGTHLGRKLIQAYFYREMPADLQPAFEKEVEGGKSEILDNLYSKPHPNLYLSRFTRFMNEHYSHPFIKELSKESFREFVKRHVCKYEGHKTLPIHFVGSIAHFFEEPLREVIEEFGLTMGQIVKAPIDNLVAYHLEKAWKESQKGKVEELES